MHTHNILFCGEIKKNTHLDTLLSRAMQYHIFSFTKSKASGQYSTNSYHILSTTGTAYRHILKLPYPLYHLLMKDIGKKSPLGIQ